MTWLALQGFGGVLAVVQRVLVDQKGWLTNEEFVEDWAVAQVLPGPNVVNLALMIGDRYFGLRGGLAALAGILTFADGAGCAQRHGRCVGRVDCSGRASINHRFEGKYHVSRCMYCLGSYYIYSNCDFTYSIGLGVAGFRRGGYVLGVSPARCNRANNQR
jgi:Chromate transporter